MELHLALLRLPHLLLHQFLPNSFFRVSMLSLRNPSITSPPHQHQLPLLPNIEKCNLFGTKHRTLVCDINGCLLRSQSFFPYFMLVAFEGGSILRALLLLLSCPLLWILDCEMKLRVMIFVTFCGLSLKDMENVSRAVLPKFFLEDLNFQAYRALDSAGFKVVFTSVPRVMVDWFLRDYLGVDSVVGTELHTVGNFFSGFVSNSGLEAKQATLEELYGEKRPDVGIGSPSLHDHYLLSLCKEAYVVPKEDAILPRNKYPKPLVFHDGRLAFLPTPLATLSMFMWMPVGFILALFRLFIGVCLPYKLSILLGMASGVNLRMKGSPPLNSNKGVLYVCTHRTLLDPVFLSMCLAKPLTAVTYSLSKMSEVIAPMKTVSLTRDRKRDGETMQKLLKEGDLVVCPEGTTCREPYLLRFSSLFAELTDEIVPVAMDTEVSMFYGTTASGLKCLDPIFFLMNPRPKYRVHILEKVPKELTCGGGRSCFEVANYLQRQLGDALGFECTNLTRKDKYLMLAGNDGVVTQTGRKDKP